jgi:hypothetical protein
LAWYTKALPLMISAADAIPCVCRFAIAVS